MSSHSRDESRAAPSALPSGALLQRYAARADCFTDCYSLQNRRPVDLARYVTAFYTTPLFRLERLVLRVLFSAPASDAEIAAMARGEAEGFSVWTVEARAPGQVLLCPRGGGTRSWLMVAPDGTGSRLYFGSALLGGAGEGRGRARRLVSSGPVLWAHARYSLALLSAARRRLDRSD